MIKRKGFHNLQPIKIWTIQDDLNFYGKKRLEADEMRIEPLIIGDYFKTSTIYTGGDDTNGPLFGEIVGIELREEDPNPIIGLEYTHRELYSVKLDSDRITVMWPNEVIKITGEVKNETK